MERRPVGVVVAAIGVGFVSLAMLAFAALTALSIAVMKNAPPPAVNMPGAVPPTASMMVAMTAFIAMLELAVAVWGLATMVGLLRMKTWSRVSVMILGGCVAAFSLLGAVGFAVMPMLLKNMPMPPNANPAQMHIVIAAMLGMCLLVAAIGVWWLVYFALRSTGEAFRLAGAKEPAAVSAVRVAAPNPMTDFTFAQPIPPEERVEADEPHDPSAE